MVHIATHVMKEIRTIIHTIAQIILSGLYLITGILRLFMINDIDKSGLFLFLRYCNFKRKLYKKIGILKK